MCVFPDEYDLAYRSILPVQVVWNKKPLNIIRTVKTDMSLVRPSVMKSWQTGWTFHFESNVQVQNQSEHPCMKLIQGKVNLCIMTMSNELDTAATRLVLCRIHSVYSQCWKG